MIKSLESLFYHKNKLATGQIPKTFQYNEIPTAARNSILIAFTRNYPVKWGGLNKKSAGYQILEGIREVCLEAFGCTSLSDSSDPIEDFKNGFNSESDPAKIMTYIQLICCALKNKYNNQNLIDKINWHLRNNGVGYKYENGSIIRIEDETYFDNVTAPVLSVLGEKGYEDTLSEFLKAYDELKNGQYNDAVTACTRGLETILKTRLDQAGKLDDPNCTVNYLLKQWFENVNVPDYMENYLNNLTPVLQGVATVRNKDGAHGSTEGDNDNLDEAFVRYIINQTAASILFIAECEFNGD